MAPDSPATKREGDRTGEAAAAPNAPQNASQEAWQHLASDPAALAEHRARLVREADQAWAEGARQETAELIGRYAALAQQTIEAFSKVPCRGSLALVVEKCTAMDMERCELRDRPGCPRRILAFEEDRAASVAQERATQAGVPLRAQEAIRAGLHHTIAKAAVESWQASGGVMLVLSGGPGVGKTIAASWALWRKAGMFVRAGSLVDRSPDREAVMRAALSVPLLVVDDLGTEYLDKNRWAVGEIETLLVRRFDEKRPTVITCNLPPEELGARYGGRVADRIGAGQFSLIPGRSLRGER